MLDSFKHKGLRKQLVTELKKKGIQNNAVLEAINNIPRHLFMDNAFLQFAYEDQAFPIGEGQTISQPYTVACQSSLLNSEKGMKVLEIGTGSGYQTAVLCNLGLKVYSIERHKPLFTKAKDILEKMKLNAKLTFGDGYKGWPAFAPFDRIIVTAGAPYIPEDLKQQLKIGGIMVIPVTNKEGIEIMKVLHKKDNELFTEEEFGEFKFVPLLKDRV